MRQCSQRHGATTMASFTTPSPKMSPSSIPARPMASAPTRTENLSELPNEVLRHILFYLEPEETLLSVQLVSRQFYSLAQEPLLWRHHCLTSFHYWDDRHDIRRRFKGDVNDTCWLDLFLERKQADITTTRLLDSILSEQIGRIEKTNQISVFGYDAKDTLKRHHECERDAPDSLARRFHSNAILDHIHRAEALKEWQRLTMQQVGRHSDITPERALACFDMFIVHDNFGDLDEVSDMVDDLKEQLLSGFPDFRHYSLRQKALAVAQFLRNNDLVGLDDEGRFADFQNNYISAALQSPKHPSLPLISVAIYCSLACRLGIDASFLAIPGHVHAIVTVEDDEMIYLDPYRSAEEVPRTRLVSTLNEWGIAPEFHRGFLRPVTLQSMVTRSAENLLNSLAGGHIGDDDFWRRGGSHSVADAADAVYSGVWAIFMMSNSPLAARACIPHLVSKYEQEYPMDGILIENYILKRPGYVDEEFEALIQETIRVTLTSDSVPKALKRRDGGGFKDKVQYEVGQVFLHKRERYVAVIIGWDEQCKQQNQWIRQQGVDQLPRGRSQSFYPSLVDDTTSRYVAEENIEILEPIDAPEGLLPLAGKYFKRWDKETHRFVSNIEDEYPDN